MITLLNGEEWHEEDILREMHSDEFYYGHLGQHALSSSSLKKLLESPKSYYSSLQRSEDKKQFIAGRLIHLMLLEPEKVINLHVIDGVRRGKKYDDAIEEYGYHNVYTKSEYYSAVRVTDALRNNDHVSFILSDLDFEVPGIGEIDGLAFRAKADAIAKDRSIIYDLKTTSDIYSWERSAVWFKYSLQAELYRRIFGADEMVFIVVDKETLDIGIFDCSNQFYQEGASLIQQAIEIYRENFLTDNTEELLRNYVIRGLL